MTTRRSAPCAGGGYTLLELLLVMVLVVVLGLATYPTFQALVLKARRSDAHAALMQFQQCQERWRAQNDRYAHLAELGLPTASPLGHYRLDVANPGTSGYELVAHAVGNQVLDAPCQVMRLIQTQGDTAYASGPDDATRNSQTINRQCWPR